jgi:hypothetical protein
MRGTIVGTTLRAPLFRSVSTARDIFSFEPPPDPTIRPERGLEILFSSSAASSIASRIAK